MKYGYSKKVELSFEEAHEKVREELKKEGFGVLTEIDVQKTLKEKIDVDFSRYVILGACNPGFAHKALLAETEIGLLLPCNVIIYEEDSDIYVSMILPSAGMSMVENDSLKEIAKEVEGRVKSIIDNI